ncbi:MAG: xanthine dehydrogenase molybdopterin binding subunit [Pseudomonadales bacterium]
MTTVQPIRKNAKVVGQAAAHESATGHVSGSAVYLDDIPVPADALHIATGFADVASGTIDALDLDAVRQAPGVVDVVVAADVPGTLDVSAVYPGDLLLARDQIDFHGQPLFAVAATSLRLAQQAVRQAELTVTATAAMLDMQEALAHDSVVLPTRRWRQTLGTAAPVVSADTHSVSGSLYLRGQEHFYLEGQVALALPEEDDEMRIYSSTQHPDEVQHTVASVLAIPMHRVRVICRRMGGAFGGKESQAAPLACMAALLARRTGRAVKYRMPRHDDMLQTGKRHDFNADYALSCGKDGVLRSAEMTLSGLCGHSPDLSEGIVDRAMFHATNAYYVPHTDITGHRPRTNTVSNTAFRGFGGPQGMLVMEAAMDELAHAARIDPLTLRMQNLYRPQHDVTHYGQTVEQFVLADLMETLIETADYRERQRRARVFNSGNSQFKKGLALTPVQFGISFTSTHLNQAGALVHIYTDGSIEVSHAGTEMGQGLYTKIAQIAAQAFAVPVAQVLLAATQTDKVPNGSPTAASSGSDMNGMAVLDACDTLKARLLEHLQNSRDWQPDAVTFVEGEVWHGGDKVPFNDLIREAYMQRVSLSATGFYKTPDIHFDKDAGRGRPFYYYGNGAAASEVIIDTSTGEYRLLRTDVLHDAGDSLNPAVDLGQIEGGFIQGAGWLTTEELLWNDSGKLTSNSPANYKIPTAHDCPPELNVDFYEGANTVPTVHRSKAVGEPPLMLAISVWCALRDACSAAGDYQVLPPLAAPATPEAVFWAVRNARGES